jgi:hypothetical protein
MNNTTIRILGITISLAIVAISCQTKKQKQNGCTHSQKGSHGVGNAQRS